MTLNKHQTRALWVLACGAGVIAGALVLGLVLGAFFTALGQWVLRLAAEHRELITIASGLCMFGSIFAMMFGVKYLILKLLDWRRARSKPSLPQIFGSAIEATSTQLAGRRAGKDYDCIDTQTPDATADTPKVRL